ncbi:MAG: HEAT repeat domain-containing protein [Polyangia bacterium]
MRPFACVLVALACGCSAMQQDARLRRQAEAVVWGAMSAPSAEVREHATRIAADVADPLLDRGLGPRMSDPSAPVRATAAVAMVRQTPPAADVLRAILDGSDAEAKVIAINAIGALGDGKARLAQLAADGDVRVRARVATAIAQWKPDGARALLGKLLHDDDAGVRGQALAGLALYGDHESLGDIAQALDDPSLGVRLSALGALVRLGRETAGRQLLALGAGSDRYLALRAAVQLSRNGRAQAALAAVRAAADDRDVAVRAAAMNAAGELGSDGYTLAATHLRDADVDVRLAAARAVIATGRHDAALPALVSALATPRRLDAADELARLGDARGVVELQASARSKDAAERRVALTMLAPLPAGHDALVAALGDTDAEIRLDAAGALLRRLLRYDR